MMITRTYRNVKKMHISNQNIILWTACLDATRERARRMLSEDPPGLESLKEAKTPFPKHVWTHPKHQQAPISPLHRCCWIRMHCAFLSIYS